MSLLHPKTRDFGSASPSAPEPLDRSSRFPSSRSAFLCCPVLGLLQQEKCFHPPTVLPGAAGMVPAQPEEQAAAPAGNVCPQPHRGAHMQEVWERPGCSPQCMPAPTPGHAAMALASGGISDTQPPRIFKVARGAPQKPPVGFSPQQRYRGAVTHRVGWCTGFATTHPAADGLSGCARWGLLGPRVGATRWVSLPPAFLLKH